MRACVCVKLFMHCFSFVKFATVEEAEAAIRLLHLQEIDGIQYVVKSGYKEHGGGGGGGRGGGGGGGGGGGMKKWSSPVRNRSRGEL